MLKQITIENFQSHKNTTLELRPGVNILVGLSDSGKSAVFRALDWVFNNRPSGDVFNSHWGGVTKVGVFFDDGTEVQRIKGKGINQYRLAEQVFEGFGQNVPITVSEALNIQDVNFRYKHGQHQGAFLLSENPGEVSRYLNRIARMEIIDRAISNIESVAREEKKQVDQEKATVKRLTEELKAYEWLPQAEAQLKAVEQKSKKVEGMTARYNQLYNLRDAIDDLEKNKTKYDWLPPARKRLADVLRRLEALTLSRGKAQALKTLCGSLRASEAKILTLSEVLKFKNRVEEVRKKDHEALLNSERAGDLQGLIEKIQGLEKDVGAKMIFIEKLRTDYTVAFPDICPLCGNLVDCSIGDLE